MHRCTGENEGRGEANNFSDGSAFVVAYFSTAERGFGSACPEVSRILLVGMKV